MTQKYSKIQVKYHCIHVYKIKIDNFDPERFSHERNEDGKAKCPAFAYVPFGNQINNKA
jgi:hypothetical protein